MQGVLQAILLSAGLDQEPLLLPPPTQSSPGANSSLWVKHPSPRPSLHRCLKLSSGSCFLGAQGISLVKSPEPPEHGLVSKPGLCPSLWGVVLGSPAWEMPRDPAHALALSGTPQARHYPEEGPSRGQRKPVNRNLRWANTEVASP